MYRQAETRQAAGDTAGAVQDFLRVAAVAPASPIRAKAEFDAATLLLQDKQWTRAAVVLEGFRRTYPQHELAADVDRKLAVAYVESGQQAKAAAEFERVAARETEDPEVRRTALWQAAELQVAAGDRAAASASMPSTSSAIRCRPAPRSMRARRWPTWRATPTTPQGRSAGSRRSSSPTARPAPSAPTARSSSRRMRRWSWRGRSMLAPARSAWPCRWRSRSPPSARRSRRRYGAYGRAEEYGVAQVTTASAFAMADLYRHLGRR